MKTYTGFREVDAMIFDNYTDEDLLVLCNDKEHGEKICTNDSLWRMRLQRKFPGFLKFKSSSTSYKNYYMYLVSTIAESLEYLQNKRRPANMKIVKDVSEEDLKKLPLRDREIISRYFNPLMSRDSKLILIKYLTENGVNINIPLDSAIRYGNIETVKYLVENGADIKDSLETAALLGQLSVVEYLVEKGADPKRKDSLALGLAAEHGSLDVVKYLVSKGADIHANDDDALKYAVGNKNLDIVKYLVSRGANIHADDEFPLVLAVTGGNLDMVKYLVENGAKIKANRSMLLRIARNRLNGDALEKMSNYLSQKF